MQQQQQEATGGKSSYKHPFLWVSEVTLGSYIREFWGAILMLFCPSLPLCFPIREVHFEQKESQQQEQQQQEETGGKSIVSAAAAKVLSHPGGPFCSRSSSRRKQEEKVAKSILFYGFQKLH